MRFRKAHVMRVAMLEIEMVATAVWLAVSMVVKGVVLAPVMVAIMEMALVRLLILLMA